MTDHWRSSASLEVLRERAALLRAIRDFFAHRQVLEVETPILSQSAPTAPYLASFVAHSPHSTASYYLQTSPEFAMKRLLACGAPSVYQLSKCFRAEEVGQYHNPEFTMLEWYRLHFTLEDLMQEVDILLQTVAQAPAAIMMDYRELLWKYCGIDCDTCSLEALQSLVSERLPSVPQGWSVDRQDYLELLMSQCVEPELRVLASPVLVQGFPPEQAQLAAVAERHGRMQALRFECYWRGIELANGYQELQDASELERRIAADCAVREQQGLPQVPIDGQFLAAMQAGLPACSGVALGVDRLLMLILNKTSVSQVMSFDFTRS